MEPHEAHAHVFGVGAATFLTNSSLREEIFVLAAIVVRCADPTEMAGVVAPSIVR